ncbi:MAG: hypothetical protein RBR65_07185 [Aliarcobacter sp.]|nr:hypothetical protein [Aliarcobacter sp.]
MIKKFILLASFSIFANADLNEKIQNILGYADYNTHKNLVNHQFANQNAYYSNGYVNYARLTQELENNGLLKLNFASTQNIDVTFNVQGNTKKSIKNLTDILKVLGHQYFITQDETVVDNTFKWTIKVKTAAAISPLRLSQELQSINCNIIDIKREGNYKWDYSIDMSNSTIYKAENLFDNKQLSLKKPTKPYMIMFGNSSSIFINSNAGNTWYPSVVFYDKDFNVLEIHEESSLHDSLKLSVPNNTKYIKIDDLYTLANLKRGINITKE